MLSLSCSGRVRARCRDYRETGEMAKNLSRVAQWLCEGKTNSLLLMGKVGSGKTTMAYAVCDTVDFLNDNINPYRCVSSSRLTKLYGDSYETFSDYMMRKRLFIDDLGAENTILKNYGNDSVPMAEVIYKRYNLMLPTIIATNLSEDEIIARYGERVFDRIRECYSVIKFNNKSLR